ncbi:MAG TPA: hypothetical protein VGN42_20205 [Pirellulales bacterium]|nr:hypothetical protein [Pirellulales bacterium]
MSRLQKLWKGLGTALTAACVSIATAGPANAQTRGPRDYLNDDDDQAYARRYPGDYRAGRNAYRTERARDITDLSRARARGEEVDLYRDDRGYRGAVGPRPAAPEYADVYDSRYHRDAAEAPSADDQRPLRSARSGHYDPRIDDYDDFGSYSGAPLGRSSRGEQDRADAPGYLNHAGREASLANGYRTRGVQEFNDGRGQGVRLDDVYPLDPSVNPRRYRGHFDAESYDRSRSDADDDRDIETFIRREMSVRPGANLRVSSTGTYTFRNYIDHGNQVNARYRQPAHRRYQYLQP